ncbi:MAG: hypothetical protein ABIU06_11770 [Anaerolineales bacterium]
MIFRDKKDLQWALIVSILILLLGSIPTWAGYLLETPDLRFRGLYYDQQDYAVHIAMMRAGAHGEWAYQFRFTTEPHSPAYVRMFYILLGKLNAWTGFEPEITFQLMRLLLGLAALLSLYFLMRKVFQTIFWARTAFLLAAAGSGLGWLQLIFNWTSTRITPIDFWLIDDYVFFSLSVFPHFAFVTAGMCIALTLWLAYLEKPLWSYIAWISCLSILVQFINPIAFATVDAGLAGATIFHWWKMGKVQLAEISALALIAIAQTPLLAYNFIVLNNDPLWSQFTIQNQTLSPPVDYYLWGFGLFWPFAIYGAISAFQEKSPSMGAAVFWIAAGFALAYLPVGIQRRFLQNITIPLAILSAGGLIKLFETGRVPSQRWRRWQKILVILLIFLTSISSIQLSLGRTIHLQTQPEEFYYPVSIDQAAQWFSEHAQYNDFVLASERTSQIIAQRASMRVYLGHEMETLAYKTKQGNVQAFFEGRMPAIASAPIKWVIYGPIERGLSTDFHPPNNLELVFFSQEMQIYKVK